MYFLPKQPSRKALAYTSVSILLTCLIVAVIVSINNNDTATLDLSFATTPTPYSLPTQIYDSPSYFATVLGQLLGKREQNLDPSQIVKNGQQQTENENFILYSIDGFLPVDVQWWQEESQQVYEYVSARLDTTISQRVVVAFVPPKSGNCAPRGTTFHEQQSIILVFANQDTTKEQLLAVLAHELGHVLIHKKYTNLSDLALTEGLATWAAGDYWQGWKGADFNSGVRSYIENDTYLPLFQNYYLEKAYDERSQDCIIHRDILLTEMASFLDYLIQNYGTKQLSSLFDMQRPELKNDQRVVYPPGFKAVYGLEFNQLEYEWLNALLRPSQ